MMPLLSARPRAHDPDYQGHRVDAALYDVGRPDYPRGAVAFVTRELGLRAGSAVVELGAGTGKLTALLVAEGLRVSAIEPLAHMRERLAERLPSARVIDGIAEEIPAAPESVEAVVAAQAFHWFDAPAALAEAHRVLRPGGGLALVWNVRDTSVPWVGALMELLAPYRSSSPSYHSPHWREALAETDLFVHHADGSFRYEQLLTEETLAARILSNGYVAVLTPEDQERLVARAHEILAESGADPDALRMPYETRVHLWRHV